MSIRPKQNFLWTGLIVSPLCNSKSCSEHGMAKTGRTGNWDWNSRRLRLCVLMNAIIVHMASVHIPIAMLWSVIHPIIVSRHKAGNETHEMREARQQGIIHAIVEME